MDRKKNGIMKYTKKFANVNEADGLVIPNPFIGHVENGQMIANTEDNKKLEVEGGSIVIANNVTPPEMVDLGLPSGTLWAKYNLGVDPTDLDSEADWYGDYPTWNIGENDIITETYGTGYETPTATDFQELINTNYIDNEWVTNYNGITGLNGRKFMKKSDHSVFIFIPAAGYGYWGSINGQGSICRMWSSTPDSMAGMVRCLFFNTNTAISVGNTSDSYSGGTMISVRAVQHVSHS